MCCFSKPVPWVAETKIFARAWPDGQLFFPTVHVHDGVVHEEASFDHVLFAQAKAEGPDGWERSAEALGSVMDAARTEGLVDPAARCWRRSLRGSLPNRDQILELAA